MLLTLWKNAKSPDNDGFTKEFYISLFGKFGPLLLKMFNYSFEKRELSASQRQGLITLKKKDRDVTLIKNWRPISLINVDITIVSKALVALMKKLIHSLISYDQIAFLKGRYIGESVCLIDDLFKYTEDKNIDGILFVADIKKAFALVDHNFMYLCILEKVWGWKDFVQWIKNLFKNSQSCVINTGISTSYFSLERGTRQDDLISLYLFDILSLHAFIQVRSDSSIKDFWFKQIEIKL